MIGLPVDEGRASEFFQRAKSELAAKKKSILLSLIGFVALFGLLFNLNFFGYVKIVLQPTNKPELCPVTHPIVPQSFKADNSTALAILNDKRFRATSAGKLSRAVQIDTQVFDNPPDVADAPEKWEHFKAFHTYLEKTFPTVYGCLEVELVNSYGLIFTWKGSNSNLKPLMLTAHQDTVPVQKDTLNDWTYPPFEGYYDGEYVYGRGSADCKNLLVALLESVELLLAKGYEPKRGVILAFGFDEEASGVRGAHNIGKFLEKKLGYDSIYAILDEGPGLLVEQNTGQIVAISAVGEKGYVDIEVELTTPGGHSSIPPDHTSIGIMSELAHLIENDQYSPALTTSNPILGYLTCLAVNSGNRLPKLTKKAILRAGIDKFANSKLVEQLSKNPLTAYLIKTSQAIDIIKGGEKANALPENVKMVVNHRIAVHTKVSEIFDHFTARVVHVASKYGLSVESFGQNVLEGDNKLGKFVVGTSLDGLEAAPVSPSNDTVWKYISGTTRHVFEDMIYTNLSYPILTLPAVMPANTDTRHYWNLTRNIYRYSPSFVQDFVKESHIHSVDEKVSMDAHLQLIAFYYEYIQNIDSSEADN